MQTCKAGALRATDEVPKYRLLAATGGACAVLASGSILPSICLVQIASEFQLSDTQSGMFFAVCPAITLITLPLFGLLSERWGKQGLLVASLLLLSAAMVVYHTATGFSSLLIGSVALGLSSSIIDALVSPLAVDLYPHRTAPVMNLLHCSFQIGIVSTAIVAGIFMARNGEWTSVFFPIMIIAFAIALVLAFSKFPSPVEHVSPVGMLGLLSQPSFWLCSIVIAMAGGVEAGILFWVPSFLQRQFDMDAAGNWLTKNLDLSDPSPLLGATGLVLFAAPMVVGRWFYGSIAERYGCIRILMASSIVCAFAIVGLGQAASANTSILWLALLGLALSGVWPTLLIHAGKTIHANPPTLFSLLAMAGLAGVGICSWGVGLLADRSGEIQDGLTALVFPALAALLALVALSHPRFQPQSSFRAASKLTK